MIYIYQPAGVAQILKIPNHLKVQRTPIPRLRLTNTETKETFDYTPTYITDEYIGFDFWIPMINNMRPGEYEYEVAGNRGMIWVGNPDVKKRIYSEPDKDTVKYYRD